MPNLEIFNTTDDKNKVTLSPRTRPTPSAPEGRPARLDGVPVITVTAGPGTFTQDPADPLTLYVVSPDAVNPPAGEVNEDTTFDLLADGDLGSGVEPIREIIVMHTRNPNAAGLGLSAGPAEPK
jgi:hypothetical protein